MADFPTSLGSHSPGRFSSQMISPSSCTRSGTRRLFCVCVYVCVCAYVKYVFSLYVQFIMFLSLRQLPTTDQVRGRKHLL